MASRAARSRPTIAVSASGSPDPPPPPACLNTSELVDSGVLWRAVKIPDAGRNPLLGALFLSDCTGCRELTKHMSRTESSQVADAETCESHDNPGTCTYVGEGVCRLLPDVEGRLLQGGHHHRHAAGRRQRVHACASCSPGKLCRLRTDIGLLLQTCGQFSNLRMASTEVFEQSDQDGGVKTLVKTEGCFCHLGSRQCWTLPRWPPWPARGACSACTALAPAPLRLHAQTHGGFQLRIAISTCMSGGGRLC